MEHNTDKKLVQELVDKKICISKAEARRLVTSMPEEKIRSRLDRVKIVRM